MSFLLVILNKVEKYWKSSIKRDLLYIMISYIIMYILLTAINAEYVIYFEARSSSMGFEEYKKIVNTPSNTYKYFYKYLYIMFFLHFIPIIKIVKRLWGTFSKINGMKPLFVIIFLLIFWSSVGTLYMSDIGALMLTILFLIFFIPNTYEKILNFKVAIQILGYITIFNYKIIKFYLMQGEMTISSLPWLIKFYPLFILIFLIILSIKKNIKRKKEVFCDIGNLIYFLCFLPYYIYLNIMYLTNYEIIFCGR